jgi:hypothetical protein
MKSEKIFLLFVLASCFLISCESDEVAKRKAEAIPSFETSWSFVDATFAYESNGLLFIRFCHVDKNPHIVHEVQFDDIAPFEGTSKLWYAANGSGLPTSFLYVVEGGDVHGESFGIDSTATLESFLTIDCLTENKVSGSFQVSYSKKNGGHSNYGLPDNFSFSEGKFDARR